jgi:hypothetical protein
MASVILVKRTGLSDNADGVLRLEDKSCKSQITLRDLTCFALREGAGIAFEFLAERRGARNYRTLLVQNVEMRGAELPTHYHFNAGIVSTNQWRPLFQNVIFSGVGERGQAQPDGSLHVHELAAVEEGQRARGVRPPRPGDFADGEITIAVPVPQPAFVRDASGRLRL